MKMLPGETGYGPAQLRPRACPHRPERTRACGTGAVPILKVEKQVPKATCQSQDRRAHFSLAPELLTPWLRALLDQCWEPRFPCSSGLRCGRPPSQLRGSVPGAGVSLQAAAGPNSLLNLQPAGEQMPGCVCSGPLSGRSQLPHWAWAGHLK